MTVLRKPRTLPWAGWGVRGPQHTEAQVLFPQQREAPRGNEPQKEPAEVTPVVSSAKAQILFKVSTKTCKLPRPSSFSRVINHSLSVV